MSRISNKESRAMQSIGTPTCSTSSSRASMPRRQIRCGRSNSRSRRRRSGKRKPRLLRRWPSRMRMIVAMMSERELQEVAFGLGSLHVCMRWERTTWSMMDVDVDALHVVILSFSFFKTVWSFYPHDFVPGTEHDLVSLFALRASCIMWGVAFCFSSGFGWEFGPGRAHRGLAL